MLRLSLLLIAAFSCGKDSTEQDPDDSPQDSVQDSPTPEGPLYWANWTCNPQGDGCEALYQTDYVISCVPTAGVCRYGTADLSTAANCTAWTGEGCAGCESAFNNCAAAWIATLD